MQAAGSFVPLRIEFRMATPVCLSYPFIFFDGLIAHLFWRHQEPEEYRCLPSKRVVKKVGELKLPLKRFYFSKDKYIYHASVSIFDVNNAYVTTIYKKFCERYLDYNKIRRKKIDRTRGYFKDWSVRLVYIPARKVVFYANGNPDAIESLIQGLPGLGKKTSIGFGAIKSFKIEMIDEDWSIVKDGVAMRSIPIEAVEMYSEAVVMAWKAPYWAKENAALCVPPFALCRLRKDIS